MAKAFQCDICNRFYTHTNHQSFYIISTEKRLDICDDCYLENVITTVYKIISSLHFELLNVLEAKQEDYDYLANLGFDKNHKLKIYDFDSDPGKI